MRHSAPSRRERTFAGAVRFASTIGPREVSVVCSDATVDRLGDVVEPNGCDLTNFRKNPVVLAQHDVNQPIARCAAIWIEQGKVLATVRFPEQGVSARADEYLGLVKAGIINATSIGFLPIKWEPMSRDGHGVRYTKWELLELSLVSVPANPSATVTDRALAQARTAFDLQRTRTEHAAAHVGRRPAMTNAEAIGTNLHNLAGRVRHVEQLRRKHGIAPKIDRRVIVAEAAFRLRRW